VEKAFDLVWHEGLLHKLVISNCYLYLTNIIASFLSGRSFTFLSIRPTAILSPSLHNFFTADSLQSN
jgi:hypothetical protein